MLVLLFAGCSILPLSLPDGIKSELNGSSKIPPAQLEKKWWNRDEELIQNKKREKIRLINIDSFEYTTLLCNVVLNQSEKSFYPFNDKPEQKESLIKKLNDLAIQVNTNSVIIEKIDVDTIYAKIANCEEIKK